MKELNPDNSVADGLIIQPSIKRFTLIRHFFVQRLKVSYCSNWKHKGCQSSATLTHASYTRTSEGLEEKAISNILFVFCICLTA
jgi:hypothetical protein